MKLCYSPVERRPRLTWPMLFSMALAALLPLHVLAAHEQHFSSPEAAVDALKTAVAARDTNALSAIFGTAAPELILPDILEATNECQIFQRRLEEKVTLVPESDSRQSLQLGADQWPFPIPLAKLSGQWFFDTESGREEIQHRCAGMNELGAIRVCRAYVEAQREYASRDRAGDGVLAYAQRVCSAPGARDGLYWPDDRPGEELSPLGPLIAQACDESSGRDAKGVTEQHSPYHGYYFKILTRQGKHAPGGKYDYMINGHMLAGFALVAWPAQWGESGVMTFIVNQQGKIFQKNLGPKTAAVARAMTTYDPDSSWTPATED